MDSELKHDLARDKSAEIVDLDCSPTSADADCFEEDDNLYAADIDISITVMTWNVDCLSETNLKSRMVAIFNEIKSKKPDIVMLQEMIDPVLMSLYDVFLKDFLVYKPETEFGYFAVMLVRKSTFANVSFKTVVYASTNMGRNLIRCHCEYLGMPMTFYTTHLESTKSVHVTRKTQLQQCVDEINANTEAKFKLLAGDLNVRDAELNNIQGMDCLKDAWIESGSEASKQYTWDMTLNDNLEDLRFSNAKCRFDRMFYISDKHDCISDDMSQEPNDRVEIKSFQLLGTERLGCGSFPSDHFGILAQFKLNLV